MATQIEKAPALKQFIGASLNLEAQIQADPKRAEKPILDTEPVRASNPRAERLKQGLGARFAESIRRGEDLTYELVGDKVKILAAFDPGDMVLLRSNLGRGDGTPYVVIATVGPKTDFDKGIVELSIGGKIGVDTHGRMGILISEKADPTKTSFSLEATRDILTGASQLPPTEQAGALHTGTGQAPINARHFWGVVLESGDPNSPIVQSLQGKSEKERAALPDILEGDTEDQKAGAQNVSETKEVIKPRKAIATASVDTKNPNAPIKLSLDSLVLLANAKVDPKKDIVWELVLTKQYLEKKALEEGRIQPLRGDEGSHDSLAEMAVANGNQKRLEQTRQRRLEVMYG